MNRRDIGGSFVSLIVLMCCAGSAFAQTPLGSGFTYQGQLSLAGGRVNDMADFEFTLWDAAADGNMIGSAVDVSNIAVVDGLFAAQLDFGVIAFNGDARWLEVSVASPAGGLLVTLSPRQPLTAVPYSLQTRGIYVNSGGNVGIGTTTPGAKLGVVGDIRVSGKVQSSLGNLDLSGGGAGVNVLLDEDGGSSDAFVIQDTGVERFRVDGNTGAVTAAAFVGDGSGLTGVPGDNLGDHTATEALNMNSFNINNVRRVGIGTSTPSSGLQVVGPNTGATFNVYDFPVNIDGTRLVAQWDGNGAGPQIRYKGAGVETDIGQNAEGGFVVEFDDVPRFTIDPAGNVGIGTTTPSTRLDVNGTVTATSFVGNGSGLVGVSASEIASPTGRAHMGAGLEVDTQPTILDQSQTAGSATAGTPDNWQSFTAGVSGSLVVVEVLRSTLGGNPGSPADVQIYEGEGTDGALLGTTTIPSSISTGWQAATFLSPIAIVAGNQYTIRVHGDNNINWKLQIPGQYAGGRSGANPDWDWDFRTYVLDPAGELSPTFMADATGLRFGDGLQHHAPAYDRQTMIVAGRIDQVGAIDTTVTTAGAIASSVRDTDGDYTITFVDGTFTKTPIITITCEEASNGDDFRAVTLSNQSATGFHVKMKDHNSNDANAPFQFIAIGER